MLSFIPDGEACSLRVLIFFFNTFTFALWNLYVFAQHRVLAKAFWCFLCNLSMTSCCSKLCSLYLLFSFYTTLNNAFYSLKALLSFLIFFCNMESSTCIYAPGGEEIFSSSCSYSEMAGSSKGYLWGFCIGDMHFGEYILWASSAS